MKRPDTAFLVNEFNILWISEVVRSYGVSQLCKSAAAFCQIIWYVCALYLNFNSRDGVKGLRHSRVFAASFLASFSWLPLEPCESLLGGGV